MARKATTDTALPIRSSVMSPVVCPAQAHRSNKVQALRKTKIEAKRRTISHATSERRIGFIARTLRTFAQIASVISRHQPPRARPDPRRRGPRD